MKIYEVYEDEKSTYYICARNEEELKKIIHVETDLDPDTVFIDEIELDKARVIAYTKL